MQNALKNSYLILYWMLKTAFMLFVSKSSEQITEFL